MKTIHL